MRRSARYHRIRLSRAFNFNDIEDTHYGARPLGHSKLETTALYTKVSTRTIHAVAGPLDRLMALMEDKSPPG